MRNFPIGSEERNPRRGQGSRHPGDWSITKLWVQKKAKLILVPNGFLVVKKLVQKNFVQKNYFGLKNWAQKYWVQKFFGVKNVWFQKISLKRLKSKM